MRTFILCLLSLSGFAQDPKVSSGKEIFLSVGGGRDLGLKQSSSVQIGFSFLDSAKKSFFYHTSFFYSFQTQEGFESNIYDSQFKKYLTLKTSYNMHSFIIPLAIGIRYRRIFLATGSFVKYVFSSITSQNVQHTIDTLHINSIDAKYNLDHSSVKGYYNAINFGPCIVFSYKIKHNIELGTFFNYELLATPVQYYFRRANILSLKLSINYKF